MGVWLSGVLVGLMLLAVCGIVFVRQSWYLSVAGNSVGIYHGVNAHLLGMDLYELDERTDVLVDDLPDATQKQLQDGIAMSSHDEASQTVEGYLAQIEADKAKAAETADSTQAQSETDENGEPVIISTDQGDGAASGPESEKAGD